MSLLLLLIILFIVLGGGFYGYRGGYFGGGGGGGPSDVRRLINHLELMAETLPNANHTDHPDSVKTRGVDQDDRSSEA